LLTKSGIMGGVLTAWSDTGAVVENGDEVLAGERVRLRVQGPDRIWEKTAIVLWVKERDVALEFDPNGPAREGSAFGMMIRRLFHSIRKPVRQPVTAKNSAARDKDKRRRPRLQVESPAKIIRRDDEAIGPHIATVTNASSAGLMFITDRDYRIGTKLAVGYPYPNSKSLEQEGNVVRVEKLPDGRHRVAVAFG
jgi:hypothetical protein